MYRSAAFVARLAPLAPASLISAGLLYASAAQPQAEDEDRLKRWRERHWEKGNTGWHKKDPNPFLKQHYPSIAAAAPPGQMPRVLVPLCGKTVDMVWLADNGAEVLGVDGIEIAVAQLAAENWLKMEKKLVPDLDAAEKLKSSPDFVAKPTFEGQKKGYVFTTRKEGTGYYKDQPRSMMLYTEARKPLSFAVADFFELGPRNFGKFSGIWDRAALYALPKEAQPAYVKVCDSMLEDGGRILLMLVEYDQTKKEGPPFSVPLEDIKALYGPLGYSIQVLARDERSPEYTSPGWKGVGPVYESCVLLTKDGGKGSGGGGRRWYQFWRSRAAE